MALVFCFGIGGCGKDSSKSSSTEAVPAGAPEAAVKRYFAAIKAKDCGELKAVAAGTVAANIDKVGCAKVFDDADHHKLRLIKIVSTVPAGRDPKARLVKIHLFAKTDRFLTVRVVPKDGRWALFNL